jgi:hypothetical protein
LTRNASAESGVSCAGSTLTRERGHVVAEVVRRRESSWRSLGRCPGRSAVHEGQHDDPPAQRAQWTVRPSGRAVVKSLGGSRGAGRRRARWPELGR